MIGAEVPDAWKGHSDRGSQESAANVNWVTLPENGWGALIAHAAGPASTRPHRVSLEDRTVAVHCIERDGSSSHFIEPMTDDDLRRTQEGIVAYLTDAGLPPPPHFWWDVRLRDGLTLDDLAEALDQAFRADGRRHADAVAAIRHLAEVMRRVVPTFLG